MADERTCALDGVPLASHAGCWRCGALFGPGHDELRADRLRLGLCRSCWRAYGRFITGAPAAEPEELEDTAGPRWLTTREAGARLRRSTKTVREMIHAGAVRAKKVPRSPGTSRNGDRYLVLLPDDERGG